MAAPQSTPDLSVVSPGDENQSGGSAPTPAGTSAPDPATPEKRRRSVPLWLLLVAVVLGVVVSLSQYQRAEQLDARVVSLTEELQTAGEQLSAYQGHLEAVRAGVGDLSAQMASLKTLVDRDPLLSTSPPQALSSSPQAQAPAGREAAPGVAAERPEATPIPVEEAATLPVRESAQVDIGEALADANQGQAALSVTSPAERNRAVIDGALSAPFAGDAAAAPSPFETR